MDDITKSACERIIMLREKELKDEIETNSAEFDDLTLVDEAFEWKRVVYDHEKQPHRILIHTERPTYIWGWTEEEMTMLKAVLTKIPLGDWSTILSYFPSKNKTQLISQLYRILEVRSLKGLNGKIVGTSCEVDLSLTPCFNRDLRLTPIYKDNIKKIMTFVGKETKRLENMICSFEELFEADDNDKDTIQDLTLCSQKSRFSTSDHD